MFRDLPADWLAFSRWTWDDISPYADDLRHRPLRADTIHEWLADWTSLTCLVTETFNRLYVRTTTHTNDEQGQTRFREYSEKVMPEARAFEQDMRVGLLESGLKPEGFEVPIGKMRDDAALYRRENLPLLTQAEGYEAEYYAITGAMTFPWDGEQLPRAHVMAKLGDQDRKVRERAWRALTDRFVESRADIDQIWVRSLDLRSQMAKNAGFGDYRSFRWRQLSRSYYSPSDCHSFQDAIRASVVPAMVRLSEQRKRSMGLEPLVVWDDHWFFRPDPLGRPPLRPFQSVGQLNSAMERIFAGLDPVLGGYYHTLREEGLLDLETREHKATAGYMMELPASRRAFIYNVVVGTHPDVVNQLHEAGHAFHVFEARHWPHHTQFMLEHMPMESLELASMAMELLGGASLAADRGGFYTSEDAARAVSEHLTQILHLWPFVAIVDEFQHWVYENTEDARDTAQCDEMWAGLVQNYFPHLDWSGLEESLRISWRMLHHIILYPFYFIEYGIAQLGAVQLWANSLEDQKSAINSYRSALSLGNTASLPELYHSAGVKFALDRATLERAVSLLEGTIASLQAV